MKLRDTLWALAAMLALTISFLPQLAQAATCTTRPYPTRNYWPYLTNTYYCTGATQVNGQDMADAVHGFTHGAVTDEIYAANTKYYLFHSPADYASSAAAIGLGTPLTVGARDWSITKFDANKTAVYTVVFEINTNNEINTNISNATGVEIGRSSDYLLSHAMNGGVIKFARPRTSDFVRFTDQLAYDRTQFDGKTACGPSGVFYQKADESSTVGSTPVYHYICSGTTGQGTTLAPAYAGKTNSNILKDAWPSSWKDPDDIFAHSYAQTYFSGDYQGNGTRTSDWYFTKGFECSKAFVKLTGDIGVIPAANMPTGCPTFNERTKCKNLFPRPERFPGSGQVFDCLPSAADANQIAIAFSEMGGSSGPPAVIPKIQADLRSQNTVVYIFADQTEWRNLFTSAGITVPSTTEVPATASGATFGGGGGLIYSVSFKTFAFGAGTKTQTIIQEKETVGHELGHAADFFYGYANQSSSTDYEDALIRDFLLLDYTNGNTSSPRLPCSTNGTAPLDGLKDENGNAICTGATLNSPYTGMTRNSQILQKAHPFIFKKTPLGTGTYTGWREFYAGSFGYQAIIPPNPASSLYPTLNGILGKGEFVCTQNWASDLVDGQPTPPATSGNCAIMIPGGYRTLVVQYYP